MDIRGHGLSDKPRDVYGDSKLWADDVHAVITTLGLHTPVLSGWSYGGVITSDYVTPLRRGPDRRHARLGWGPSRGWATHSSTAVL